MGESCSNFWEEYGVQYDVRQYFDVEFLQEIRVDVTAVIMSETEPVAWLDAELISNILEGLVEAHEVFFYQLVFFLGLEFFVEGKILVAQLTSFEEF